jgi:transketolase
MTKFNLQNDLDWIVETQRVAKGIRQRVLEHTINTNGGYLSQACSSAEIFAILYTKAMNIGPSIAPMIPPQFSGVPGPDNLKPYTGYAYNGPKAPNLDRFFISPVQYATVLYATLVEVNRMSPEGLAMFNKDGSTVEMIGAEHSPGHEITAGSLGQALSQVIGISLARKLNGDSGLNWIFMSDGEFQIGQTWEAFEIMKFHQVDNIRIVVDVNGQQADGAMVDVLDIEPLDKRLEAFGARVFRVNGHDVAELHNAMNYKPIGQPLVILADTDTCRGIPNLQSRRPKLHYVRFKDQVEKQAYIDLQDEWIRDRG